MESYSSFLPMLNLELNQIGLSEPVRYSWLGQKSPRPSLEGCGGRVSLFFLRPPGRARKCSKLSKGLRALRSWESLRREKAGESRREPARAGESRREPVGSAERPLLSFWAVCVHTHPESSVCTHSPRIECVRTLAGVHFYDSAHALRA